MNTTENVTIAMKLNGKVFCYDIPDFTDPEVRGEYRARVVVENETGYYPTDQLFLERQAAVAFANVMNQRLGITPERAQEIVSSSISASIRAEGLTGRRRGGRQRRPLR